MFGAFGALGGAIVSFLPAVLSAAGVEGVASAALPSVSAVLGNAALLGGAAAWLGVGIGADVGANAGAVNAGLDEQRAAGREGASPAPSVDRTPPKMFNMKAALTFGALFAVFGALVAMSTFTAPAVTLLGFAAGSKAASLACAAVLGLFGCTMGINFPVVSNKLANGYARMLKGNSPHAESEPSMQAAAAVAPAQEVERTPEPESARPAVAEERGTKHSSRLVSFSYTDITQRSESKDHSECSHTIGGR